MWKCTQCGKWVQGKKHAHICVDRTPRRCIICGKEYVPFRNDQECCSKKCGKKRDNMKATKRRIELRERKKTTLEERVCPVCGETFIPRVANQVVCGKEVCKKKRHSERDRARFGSPALNSAVPMPIFMSDPYENMVLYFDGLHPAGRHMPGRTADPMLGF